MLNEYRIEGGFVSERRYNSHELDLTPARFEDVNDKIERNLITLEDPKSPISEAYRTLRTSIMYSDTKKNKTILVSSPGPGEGKTTTVANLALTYANLGKKTILIDTDLRKPVNNKVFSLDKVPGLTNHLINNEKFEVVIKETDIENLHIIPSGVVPPNPSELLYSDNMKAMIDSLKQEYDMTNNLKINIKCPPRKSKKIC